MEDLLLLLLTTYKYDLRLWWNNGYKVFLYFFAKHYGRIK